MAKKIKTAQQMKTQLKKAATLTGAVFDKSFREGMLKTHGYLILFTPKETSWASKHWNVGLNKSYETEGPSIDPILMLKAGDIVYHTNNVPYIGVLDEGHSLKRPNGFTHLVTAKMEQHFNIEFTKISSEKLDV